MPELLTSLDVVNQSFKKSLRGYDPAEVDEFLDHVAETLQSYNQKNKELERDLAAKQESLAEYDKMKDVLHEALLMAQKSADDRIKSARDQANKMLADAKEEADNMRDDAVKEAADLRNGIAQIRDIRERYAQEFRGMLGKFETQLTQVMSQSQLAGAVESALGEDERDEAEKEQEAPADAAVPAKHEGRDFEAACGLLGVDPKDIASDDRAQL